MIGQTYWVDWLPLQIRTEARAVQPVVKTVHVVTGGLALTKQEDVNDAQRQRHCRQQSRNGEAHFQRAEAEEQHHYKGERAARHEPKQIAVQTPCPSLRIISAVRVGKSKIAFGAHFSFWHLANWVKASPCSLEAPHINGGTADAESGEQRFHDDGRTRDDESADDGKLPGVGVAAPDGEAAADDAERSEEKPDEHHDAQRR